MRRGVLGLDRVVVLLLGLALIAGGLALVGWQAGWLAGLWPDVPDDATVDPDAVTSLSWYATVVSIAGALLLVLGVWWALAHLPRRRPPELELPDAGRPGRTAVVAAPAVETAAQLLGERAGVLGVRGTVVAGYPTPVVRLRIEVDPAVDLDALAGDVQDVLADLRTLLPQDDLRARVELSVRSRVASGPRVS